MAETDSMRIMVAKFYGKENESVAVNYAGASYVVNPQGAITVNDRGNAVHEVIGSNNDFREEMFKPIVHAQMIAVRFSFLENLRNLNIQVISEVIDKYNLSLDSVDAIFLDAAFAEIRQAIKPKSTLFTLFSQQAEKQSPVQMMQNRIYQVLENVDQIKTYQNLNDAMQLIKNTQIDPPAYLSR